MTYEWHDLVGNIGVFCVLATYLLVQMGRMDIRRPTYSATNATGLTVGCIASSSSRPLWNVLTLG